MHRLTLRVMTVLVVIIMTSAVIFNGVRVQAQTLEPWNAGDSIRQALFAAQTALLSNDSSGAETQVNAALIAYTQSLRTPLLAAAPDVVAGLDSALKAAQIAAHNGDALGLAAARSQVWVGLVHGNARIVFKATQSGNVTAARQWLQLRDFQTPTKFSRPNSDATLALNNLSKGSIKPADALNAVRADLLDTYQGKLNEALISADNAQQQNFTEKEVEQAALAAGYFDLLTDTDLSNTYVTLHSSAALATTQATFSSLVQAAMRDNTASYHTARAAVDTALKGFRAAPLSDAEQARRAGQLTQFVSLVPIEYARGVAHGQIVNDLEIQEALTFRDGASAAFTDLQTLLDARDPKATAQVATLLTMLKTQINTTADPAVVGDTASAIGKALTSLYPASWQTLNSGSDFDVINTILNQIEPAVQQGQYAQAESSRLQAYAILDSGIEQKLRGFAPEMALQVESLFWQGDGKQPGLAVLLTSNASVSQIETGLAALRTALTADQNFLNSSQTAPAAVVTNAAIIVFREGLEAVLILASLVASMRMEDSRKYRRAILVGAGLALVAAAVTWWIANDLLMSMIQYGERLSVVVGMIAIGVLLLITNWFFHKTYWVGWMANFHKQKSRILGGTLVIGPSLGLIILGFTSIYREGFEVVLFLQSLVLDAGLLTVLKGAALGLLGTAIVGLLVFGLQVRLPAKRLFIVTGILIGGVLLTMVGTTVQAAQSVGWMTITPITGFYIPYWMGQWFGLFATWQGVLLQVLAGAFVIGSYVLAERINMGKRTKLAPQNKAATADVPVTAQR